VHEWARLAAADHGADHLGVGVEAWSLNAFPSWFRVSVWFQTRPYSIRGGFRWFQDISGRFRVGGLTMR
jgi:hypothetical protein